MKQGSDRTDKQLCLELEASPFKWVTKDDLIAATGAIERTTTDGIMSSDKLIEAQLKHADRAHDDILSLAKCRMSVSDKNDKNEVSKQLEQPYVCFLISLNSLTLLSSLSAQLMSSP